MGLPVVTAFSFYFQIFSDVSFTISSLSENEASRYGRFLYTMLEIVSKWHSSKTTYDKVCESAMPHFLGDLIYSGDRDS